MEEQNYYEEITLVDIYNFCKQNYRFVLKVTAFFVLVGFIYGLLTNPKYEATANVQMAMVANNSVESPATLVEKLKIPTYFSVQTLTDCDLEKSETAGEDLVKSLKPTLNKNAPIVTLSHTAKSAAQSKRCIDSVLVDIRKDQNVLAGPIIASKKSLLNTVKQKLEIAEHIKNQLSAKTLNFDFNDTKFSASTLLFATTLSKENEIKDLNQQVFDIEQSLSFPQTTETFLASPIHEKKVSNRLIVLVASLFFGVFIGTFIAVVKNNLNNLIK